MIQQITKNGQPRSPEMEKQVRDEVLTLFVAGHETTATALAWSVYLLCRHPEIYQRAQAEADALGRPPGLADLPRLPLLLQIFKESLRLYPPVPLFSREVSSAVDIGGYHLPRGTLVFISPYATQHRGDLWPDPERFDPSRFSPAAEEARFIAEYKEKFANPYHAASLGYVDEVIRPRQTRLKLIQSLRMLRNKRQSNPPKKHGNIPL